MQLVLNNIFPSRSYFILRFEEISPNQGQGDQDCGILQCPLLSRICRQIYSSGGCHWSRDLYCNWLKGGTLHHTTVCYLRSSDIWQWNPDSGWGSFDTTHCTGCTGLSFLGSNASRTISANLSRSLHFSSSGSACWKSQCPQITLTNIFCSHIFNLCQVVFIDCLFVLKEM